MTDKPENNPISNDQIDPDHSKPLDVHRWSDHPEINKLVNDLWFQVVQPALGGKSNNKGKSDPKRQLKVLLLDLYVHLIPRRDGDVAEPKGGVRGVIPQKQSY
jgi:hypothetical protein